MAGRSRGLYSQRMDIPRSPWPPDFPRVIVFGDQRTRNQHAAYAAAKAGDPEAAWRLVNDMLIGEAIAQINTYANRQRLVILPVSAIESAGFNAIPNVFGEILSARCACQFSDTEIVQSNRVHHTRANGWHRLVTPATFEGTIRAGTRYFLVDDLLASGAPWRIFGGS